LLAEAKGFTFSRFEYRAESGLKPHAAGVGDPDVVVATLDSFQATNQEGLFSSLRRAFPHRPVLVTTTHPDAFDVFPVLEMGAADFLLPPLRRSELLPRLMRQARVTCHGDALVQKLKEDIGLKQIIGESPALLNQCFQRFGAEKLQTDVPSGVSIFVFVAVTDGQQVFTKLGESNLVQLVIAPCAERFDFGCVWKFRIDGFNLSFRPQSDFGN
jgi:hypothetical protein